MMKQVRLYAAFLSLYSVEAFAVDVNPTSATLNFGSWYQANSTASLTMDYTGIITGTGMSDGPSSGSTSVVKFTHSQGNKPNVTTTFPSSINLTGGSGSSCTITASNFTATKTSFTMSNGESFDMTYGATLTINSSGSFCPAGTYTGMGTVSYRADKGPTIPDINLNLSITLASKVSLENRQNLDFGEMVSPVGDGIVVLSTNGERTASGITLTGTITPKQGQFALTGIPNLTVTVGSIAPTTLSNGKDNLTVTNFVTDYTTYTLDASGNALMNIGATLQVPANVSDGNYTGTYTVMVSY